MIFVENLTKEDIGRDVIYTNGVGDKEQGRIKSWNEKWIFVVYHCANDWDNYQDYTAAATSPSDLKFYYGDELNRFHLMDFED
jgi:hypothetical protein